MLEHADRVSDSARKPQKNYTKSTDICSPLVSFWTHEKESKYCPCCCCLESKAILSQVPLSCRTNMRKTSAIHNDRSLFGFASPSTLFGIDRACLSACFPARNQSASFRIRSLLLGPSCIIAEIRHAVPQRPHVGCVLAFPG